MANNPQPFPGNPPRPPLDPVKPVDPRPNPNPTR